EAMATARPIVSTRLAAVPEIVRAGESGLLVAPGHVEGLANALESLLRDPHLRTRLGAAGRRNVEERFDVDETAAQLLELVEAARCALYLVPKLARNGIRHVHATDSRALLCAWILQRLAKITISATIESPPAFASEVVERLLASCAGGRVSNAKIRAGFDGR